MDITFDHYASSATLRWTSNLDMQDDFWGVNDVRVSLVQDHPSPPAPPHAPGVWNFLVMHDRWPGATGWSSSIELDNSAVTSCGSLGTMIGGYGKLGATDYIEKTLTSLSPHRGVRISANFFKIDQWNGKKGQLYIDGALSWESSVYHGEPAISDCCCGVKNYQQGDLVTTLDITVSHSADAITIRFTTNLDEAEDFWGVNDVQVSFVQDHPSPPAPPSAPGVWTLIGTDSWPGATGWVSNVAIAESTCGELGSLVGGFEIFGMGDYIEKTYTDLPAHTGLRVEGTFFKIDGWNSKFMQMLVDGAPAWQSDTAYGGQPAISSGGCGVVNYNQGDLKTTFDVTVAHYGDNATVRFTTNLDSAGDYCAQLPGVSGSLPRPLGLLSCFLDFLLSCSLAPLLFLQLPLPFLAPPL